MIFWLPILILSAQAGAPMDHRYAETIFQTDFEGEADLNYDGWPDDWTRRRGQGFPQYVSIRIADDPSDVSHQSHCLSIELDGSGGTVYSPPIEISPLFSYMFQGKLKTEGLTHDVAYFSVTFFDPERTQKEIHTSEKFVNTSNWQEVQIGPLTPAQSDARFAVIGLHLVPTDRSDLTGTAMFDDVRFARLPHMTITSSQPYNIFADRTDPEFTCAVSGVKQPDATLLLELLDVQGDTLASERLKLTASQPPDSQPTRAADSSQSQSNGATADAWAASALRPAPELTGQTGSVSWHPPIPGCGFYRLRASLVGDNDVVLQHCVALAVLEKVEGRLEGEFGWSLPRGEDLLPEDDLVPLLSLANVNWVKYPIWYSPENEASKGDRIASLGRSAERTRHQDGGGFRPTSPGCCANDSPTRNISPWPRSFWNRICGRR